MIYEAKSFGAQRLSLAFAAFPEVFKNKDRNRLQDLVYHAIHLLDSLIALESLYRYLRKFHALGDRRYVLLSLRHIMPAVVVLVSWSLRRADATCDSGRGRQRDAELRLQVLTELVGALLLRARCRYRPCSGSRCSRRHQPL